MPPSFVFLHFPRLIRHPASARARPSIARLVATAPPRARVAQAGAAAARPSASGASAKVEPASSALESIDAVEPWEVLGFRAATQGRRREEIGTVEQVLGMGDTGEAHPLIKVCRPVPAAEAGGQEGAREEHLIPWVPSIVSHVDRSACLVLVDPPPGLLALGRRRLLLAQLRGEVAPYTRPPPGAAAGFPAGARLMPTRRQLHEAGRGDLARLVSRAGGFTEVAQALGLRSRRRPASFWEDETNLDLELSLFVAAHWAGFRDPESGGEYWYNQVTHRVTWEPPQLPELIELDDEGGRILTGADVIIIVIMSLSNII